MSREEAQEIANFLNDAKVQVSAPRFIGSIYAGFKAIADGREFGGH